MENNQSNYFEQISTVETYLHKKFIFNWTFFIAFLSPLILTCIYFIMFISGVKTPPSWVNWLFLILFLPLITSALIFTQRKQLVGAYGETILVLIPTFVWLLPGHADATKWLIIISFAIIFCGGISYGIGVIRRNKNHHPTTKSLKVTQIFLRLGFVAASVVSTVIISVVLLEWADNSVHLAPKDDDGNANYSSGSWIFFIAAVTILDALLLVFLGLITNYEASKEKKNKHKDEDALKNGQEKSKQQIEDENLKRHSQEEQKLKKEKIVVHKKHQSQKNSQPSRRVLNLQNTKKDK